MGVPSINSLANMEYMLYGGYSGLNRNCPSYYNGYMSTPVNYYNNINNYAGTNNIGAYYNPAFNGGYNVSNYYPYTASNASNQQSTTFSRASKEDLDVLGKYYLNGLAPSESMAGAATGGAMFALIQNPRIIAHPLNSFSATKITDKMFSGIKKENSNLYKLWRGENSHEIMHDAYAYMHKLNARTNSKLGLFRSRIKADSKIYKDLRSEMEKALSKKNPSLNEIATVTEKIKRVTSPYDGKIGKPFEFFRKLFGGNSKIPPDTIAQKKVNEAASKTLMSRIKHGCSAGGALFFMLIEFALGLGKIKDAFKENSGTGWTQVGQTAVKGLGSAIGWGVGEALGAAAGAKLGAIAGTAIAPGIGTAIGAIAGLVGGSIGCMITGKITNKIVGQDIADKIKVDKMKSTQQGQVELLQLTMQQALNDKKLDSRTAQALQNVYSIYA